MTLGGRSGGCDRGFDSEDKMERPGAGVVGIVGIIGIGFADFDGVSEWRCLTVELGEWP